MSTSTPDLPDDFDWPKRTRDWWAVWCESRLTDDFTSTDWDFLLDTALIHADFWQGNTGVASELRARLAKLGATADDRKRLGIGDAKAKAGDPVDEIARRRTARGAGSATSKRQTVADQG